MHIAAPPVQPRLAKSFDAVHKMPLNLGLRDDAREEVGGVVDDIAAVNAASSLTRQLKVTTMNGGRSPR